jgi:chemotaxis protein histidine kinase CheA
MSEKIVGDVTEETILRKKEQSMLENENESENDDADEQAYEEDYHRLMSQGKLSSSLLNANCFEFDKYQWLSIVQDHSNKEISTAMKAQGETRYNNQNEDDNIINQKYLYEKGNLYIYQRNAILERLERGYDGKRDRNPKLALIFPAYVPPPIQEIKISVTCQVMNAAPKTKKVLIKLEEGLSTAIKKSKEAHKGLSMKMEYELISLPCNEIMTEENFAGVEDGAEFKLQEVKAAASAGSSKGKASSASNSKSSSKKAETTVASAASASSTASATANATVVQRRLENSIRLVTEDVMNMVIPVSSNIKFHEKMSLLSYMMYWAAVVVNGLNGLLRDSRNNVIEISRRDAVDCLISLQRSLRDMRSACPIPLVAAAEDICRKLEAKVQSLNMNLLTLVSEEYPELIDKSTYDYSTPRLNRLYDEQGKVLDILHEKLLSDSPCVIGYRVPPSG